MHVLRFTHGEASTLNENHAELRQARAREIRQAAAELGIASVTLLGYPDGQLAAASPGELSGHVTRLAARHPAEGLLHASQISPGAVLWRRLQLQGDCEHLRWLLPPGDRQAARPQPAAG